MALRAIQMNKLSIGRMKAQLAVSAPEFDPYDQPEIIAKTFLERARAEQHRDKPNMRLIDDLLDKAARVLRHGALQAASPHGDEGVR